MYAKQRVLVTGATGFIGQHVARALAASGAEVFLAGRAEGSLRQLAATLGGNAYPFVADLARPGAAARLYQEITPDLTLNLAGYGIDRTERDSSLFTALNVELPTELARAAGGVARGSWSGLAVVHCGSGFEYGPVAGPVSEDSVANPTSEYARTKLAGSQQFLQCCSDTGLAGAVARLFVVYGPGEHPARLLPSLVAAKRTGASVAMTAGQQRRDFTFVGDAVEGLLRIGLLEKPPGILNVATGVLTSVRQFAETAAEVLGLEPKQLQFGALPYREDEVAQGPVSDTRILQVLGWKPRTTVREGIRKTVRQ